MSYLNIVEKYKHLLSAFAISSLGFALIYMTTLWGVGVSPDSVQYINGARNLDSFSSLFELPSHWPPGYSILLSLAEKFSTDILMAARILQASIFAANIFMLTLISAQLLRTNHFATNFASLLLVFSVDAYLIHFYALSEGAFIFLQLLSTLALIYYFRKPSNKFLYISASLAATALMFRYSGVSYIGAMSLTLLLIDEGNFTKRLTTSIKYFIVGIAPFILWMVANHIIRNETANRELIVHVVSWAELKPIIDIFAGWLSVFGVLYFIAVSALLIASGCFVYRKKSNLSKECVAFFYIGIIYSLCYIIFIILSKSFIDAYIPFSLRIFIPVHVFLLLCSSVMLSFVFLQQYKIWQVISTITLLLLINNNVYTITPNIHANIERGRGFLNAYYFLTFPVIHEIEGIEGKTIYSNANDLIQLKTDYHAEGLPRKLDPTTLIANPDYEAQIQKIQKEILDEEAILIYYNSFSWRQYYPTTEDLLADGFIKLASGEDIQIFFVPENNSTIP